MRTLDTNRGFSFILGLVTSLDMREANDKQGWQIPVTSRGSRRHVSSFSYFLFSFFLRSNEGTTTGASSLRLVRVSIQSPRYVFIYFIILTPIIYRHDSDAFCDHQNGPRQWRHFLNQCFIYLDFNNEIQPTQPQYGGTQLRIGHDAGAKEQRRGRWAVLRYYQDDIRLMTSKGLEVEQGRKDLCQW